MRKQEAIRYCLNKHFPKFLENTKFCFSKDTFIATISKESYSLKELGYTNTASSTRAIKKLFPNKPRNIKICTYLLQLENLSYCISCKIVKDISAFHVKTDRIKGIQSSCKDCCKLYQKDYQINHREEQSARTNKRRAAELQAIPKWADLNLIDEFYKNRPIGYHVDHIVPLQGKEVCGLHVVNNLQYLPAKENLMKANKLA